jgi:hypothetical protein
MQGLWMERIMIVCDVNDDNVVIVSFQRAAQDNGTIDIIVNQAVMV